MAGHPPPRWPWTLWTFSLVIAVVGALNLWLALDQVRRADELRALGVSYPPLLRAGFALVWGVLLLACALGLAAGRRWALRWTWLLLSNYGAFGVLWMIAYADSQFGRDRIPFQAALTVLLVGVAVWVLRWQRVRRAFEPARPAPPDNPSNVTLET